MCDQSLSLNGLRVLVVDNNSDCRDILKMVFEDYGIEMIAATCVSEALEILKQIKPDVLISEIALPNEDGFSLMHKVRAIEVAEQVEIPAIALTTYDTKYDRAYARLVGFCKHLSKPVDFDLLITTVLSVTRQIQLVSAA
jgi:two-component system OmpR family response regulator